MPYIIRDEEKYRLSIFAILFPEDNSFFIWKTPADNLKKTYKNHYYCQIKKTKELFEKAKKKGNLPPMYCLETVETSQEEAFLHCVAWAKYFIDQGLISCCGEFLDKYTETLGKETAELYASIRDQKMEDVCPDDGGLFPKFGREKVRKAGPKNNAINIRMMPDEYKEIKDAADEAQVTITAYCKKMIQNGRVIHVDQDVFDILSTYVNEYVVRDQLLKTILSAIYSTRTYYPADLRAVQEAIGENSRQQREAIEEVKALLRLLLDR